MPWKHDQASRQREAQVYGPQWRQARLIALRRARHRCERCGSEKRIQVDHMVPVSQGGTHAQSNLMVLCEGCHQAKTARDSHATRSGGVASQQPARADPAARPTTVW